MKLKDKQLIVFDLDKTLAESKQEMDDEMAGLLRTLLTKKKVAVISGGSFAQFEKQFIRKLAGANFKALFLFPTCGSAFYRQEGGQWRAIYTETLLSEEKAHILQAFEKMLDEVGVKKPEKIYGDLIEDRHTQITFAAHGSQAPLHIKSAWDPDRMKRLQMIAVLARHLPDFEIRTGGTSSIDVTRKGIDKAYGIRQMEKHLGIPKSAMAFIGDDLGEGGNDFPVIATGVAVTPTRDPSHTKEIIRSIIEAR